MRVVAFVWLGFTATVSTLVAQKQPAASPLPDTQSPQSYTPPGAVAVHLLPQYAGSISGTLAGDDGSPILGAVSLNGAGGLAGGRSTSAADGSFVIANLPAGIYTLCASPSGRGYLDPCTWSTSPPSVTVAPGQAATTHVVLHKGAVIDVRLNDPQGALAASVASPAGQAASPGAAAAPQVILYAQTPKGVLEPLVISGKDATGMDQQTTIPFSTPVNISITVNGVQVADSAGHSLSAPGSFITVQQGSSSPASTVTLQVSKP